MIFSRLVLAEATIVDPANEILKWCQNGGESVRYASANIEIAGYDQCGKPVTVSFCDPMGNKYIGKVAAMPYQYRDCSINRIRLEREGQVVDVKQELRRQEELARQLENDQSPSHSVDRTSRTYKNERINSSDISSLIKTLMPMIRSFAGGESSKEKRDEGTSPDVGVEQLTEIMKQIQSYRSELFEDK